MLKRIGIFALVVLFTLPNFKGNAKEYEQPVYIQYVEEVIYAFVKEMGDEYGFECIASGGKMPSDVEEISVSLAANRNATVSQARELMIKATERFAQIINEHPKIRPFLREFPFPVNRADVSFSFRRQTMKIPFTSDNVVDFAFQARNRIFYRAKDPDNGYEHRNIKDEPYEIARLSVHNSAGEGMCIADFYNDSNPISKKQIAIITVHSDRGSFQNAAFDNVISHHMTVPEGTFTVVLPTSQGFLRGCRGITLRCTRNDGPAVIASRDLMGGAFNELGKIHHDSLMLHMAYGDAGKVDGRAFCGLPPRDQDVLKRQLYLLAIGPEKSIPLDCALSVINIHSKYDVISDCLGLKHFENPKFALMISRSESGPQVGFNSTRLLFNWKYKLEELEYLEKLREKEGFCGYST